MFAAAGRLSMVKKGAPDAKFGITPFGFEVCANFATKVAPGAWQP